MYGGRTRVGPLALVAALAVLGGSLRPGEPVERSEGSFPVGGITALPSALPATVPVPGISPGTQQILPAVAPASGPGSLAIVDVFCEGASCPRDEAGNVLPIEFTISRVFPPGAPAATFASVNPDGSIVSTGEQTLACTDDASCDLSDRRFEPPPFVQHVAVGLTGGGENEVIDVTACDIAGDCRSVQVVFVETLLVFPPLTDASAADPVLVSYRCDDVGRYTGEAATGIVPGGSWSAAVTWEEVFSWFFSGFVPSGRLRTPASVLPMNDIPFYSCGGDTVVMPEHPEYAAADRVTFETDSGILSVESAGDVAALGVSVGPGLPPAFRPFGSIAAGCDGGDSVHIRDHPGPVVDTRGWSAQGPVPFVDPPADYCDLDFAPNGVVTYTLWGTGETGVATVTGQQSGGGGVLRTGYPSFAGLGRSILVMESPEVIGLDGGRFSLVVLDEAFRFLGGETVACLAEPLDAVIAIIPQTATSGAFPEPFVNFTLYPTRSAVETGVDVTITCYLDSNPDVKATATARIGKPAETVELVVGCNFQAWTGDQIDPSDLAERVAPAEHLSALWAQQPPPEWKGFDPEFPEVSDMGPVDQLDVVAVCTDDRGTFTRPAL